MKFLKTFLFPFLGILVIVIFTAQLSPSLCEPEVVCYTPADCAGLVHPECVGKWKCENKKCVWDCTMDCIAEGGKFEVVPGEPAPQCCDDLVSIQQSYPKSDGTCVYPKCLCYVCTNCGDNKCGKGENFCNCPDDCPKTSKKCGPFPGGTCASGEVCNILSCALGASGICVKKPDACVMIYDPVCGCDGKTYSNDCVRLMKGVALKHKGEC